MLNPPRPPSALAEPLELDSHAWTPQEIYHLHSALVVPRPIAWVSTLGCDGTPNLAPHSYFNAVCDDPPCVMFSIEGESDTYRNLSVLPEFVVNFVTPELVAPMELTACHMPPEESEFGWAGVRAAPAQRVAPFRVAESKACLECKVIDVREIGNRPNHIVVGEVLHYAVSASIWSNGRIDPHLYRPVGRLAGRYVAPGAIFKLSRPQWAEAKAAGAGAALGLVQRFDEPPKSKT
jgi:flavin reductase (DIM6/NTAB) family NADH-FMN oxidoreductase RutF